MANTDREVKQILANDKLVEVDTLISNVSSMGSIEEKNNELAVELKPFSEEWKAKSDALRQAFQAFTKIEEEYRKLKLELEQKENAVLAQRVGFRMDGLPQKPEEQSQARLAEIRAQCLALSNVVADQRAKFETDYKQFNEEKEKKKEIYCYRRSLIEAIDLYIELDRNNVGALKIDRKVFEKETKQTLATAFDFKSYNDFLDPEKVSALKMADIIEKHSAFLRGLQNTGTEFLKFYQSRIMLNRGDTAHPAQLVYPSVLSAEQRGEKFAELLHAALNEAIKEIEKMKITDKERGLRPKGKVIELFKEAYTESGHSIDSTDDETTFAALKQAWNKTKKEVVASLEEVPKYQTYKEMTKGILNVLGKSTHEAFLKIFYKKLEFHRKQFQAVYPWGTEPIFTITGFHTAPGYELLKLDKTKPVNKGKLYIRQKEEGVLEYTVIPPFSEKPVNGLISGLELAAILKPKTLDELSPFSVDKLTPYLLDILKLTSQRGHTIKPAIATTGGLRQLIWNVDLFEKQDRKRTDAVDAAKKLIGDVVVTPESAIFSQTTKQYETTITEEKANLVMIAEHIKSAESSIASIDTVRTYHLVGTEDELNALLEQNTGWTTDQGQPSVHVPEQKIIHAITEFKRTKGNLEEAVENHTLDLRKLQERSATEYTRVDEYKKSDADLVEMAETVRLFQDVQQKALLKLSREALLGQIKSILLDQIAFWSTKRRVYGEEIEYIVPGEDTITRVKVPTGIGKMIKYIAAAEARGDAVDVMIKEFATIANVRLQIKGLITKEPLSRHPETKKCYEMLRTLLGPSLSNVKTYLNDVGQINQGMQKLNDFRVTQLVKPKIKAGLHLKGG